MKPLNRILMLLGLFSLLLFLGTAHPALASDAEQSFSQPILVVNTSFLNVRTGPGIQYTTLVTVVGGTELPVLGTYGDNVWYQVNTDGGPGWVNVEFTLPRGDFTNVPLVDVGETGAPNVDLGQGGGYAVPYASDGRVQGVSLVGKDLHAQPDYESLIISRAVPNDPHTIYPLINFTRGTDGTTWYQVDVPGAGIGWMDAVQFRVLSCNGRNVGITTSETPINFNGISTQEPYLLPANTEGLLGDFRGARNEYVRFELADGTIGYVSYAATRVRSDVQNVCTNVPATTNANPGQGGGGITGETRTTTPVLGGNHVVINTGFLNVRSGPSSGYATIATVAGGTELAVLGRAADNVWFLVEGAFGQGWVNNQFTLFRGDYSTVPVIDNPVVAMTNIGQGGGGGSSMPSSQIASGRHVTGVSTVGKDMHQAPTYESMIISRAVPNDLNTVYPLLATETNNGTTWYLVDVPNVGRGWMDAVELRILECGNDSIGVLTSTQPITFDGFSNREPYLLPMHTEFYITGRNGNQAIIELLDGSTGLVPADAVVARTGVHSVCAGVSQVASTQTRGTTTVTSNTVVVPQVTGNRVVVNTGNLNVRSGPSSGFSIVATVPGGSELAVTGRATDGVWYFVEGTFGQGWVNSQYVLFRGDYGSVPVVDFSG